jgi:hypothetical protein
MEVDVANKYFNQNSKKGSQKAILFLFGILCLKEKIETCISYYKNYSY